MDDFGDVFFVVALALMLFIGLSAFSINEQIANTHAQEAQDNG